QAAAPAGAMVKLYRETCLQCHDNDGRGGIVRDTLPKVPDFTDVQWQAARSDAELARSILDGKGKSMPRMRDKLGAVPVKEVVAFVRAFRGGRQTVEDEDESPSASPPTTAAALPTPNPHATDAGQGAPAALQSREARRVFQRFCAACHGLDGKGSTVRDTM